MDTAAGAQLDISTQPQPHLHTRRRESLEHEFSIQPPKELLSAADRRVAEANIGTCLTWYDTLGPTERLKTTKRWPSIRSSALVREMLCQALSQLACDNIMRYFLTCIVTEFTAEKPDDVDFRRVHQHLANLSHWSTDKQQRVVARVDDFAVHIVNHFLAPS
jgi:hypothetical protein